MPNITIPGRYAATVKSAEVGESQNGTPFISLYLETDEGQHISHRLYLTDKAFDYSLKALKDAFGFDGVFETVTKQISGQTCSITCDFETGSDGKEYMRVKWLNAARKAPTKIDNEQAFLAALTKRAGGKPVASAPKTTVKPDPAPEDDDIPF